MIEPSELLAAIAGYVRPMIPDPIRMGTIDAGYVSGQPAVVFDGESIASGKTYPYLDSYTPSADDRVVLVPVGGTWLIIGSVS